MNPLSMSALLLDLPLPVVTPRLVLRPPSNGDGKVLYQTLKSTEETIRPWLDWYSDMSSEDVAEFYVRKSLADWVLRKKLRFLCYMRKNKKLIGEISLDPVDWDHFQGSLKYWIHQDYEGFGFMSEAINGVTRYAFECLKLNRVEVNSNSLNKKNLNLINRLGFEFEGRLKAKIFNSLDGTFSDRLIFSRLNTSDLAQVKVDWGEEHY